jgi:hypothetical protein
MGEAARSACPLPEMSKSTTLNGYADALLYLLA